MNSPTPTIAKLTAALIEAQRKFQPALKTAFNPHFKSRYVDLAGVIDSCREALHANGLTVVQTTAVGQHGPVLRSILLHTSGEQIDSEYPLTPAKNDPQGMGSAVTYARRYSLMALLGIAAEDDDGEGAQNRSHSEQRQQAPQGNGHAPRSGGAPASSATTTRTAPVGGSAPTPASATTSPTTKAPEPTAGEIRQSHERAKEHQQLLNGAEATVASLKKTSEVAYQELKKLHAYLAVGLWKATKTWNDKADLLSRALAAVQRGNEQLGPERFWDIIAEILGQEQWPTAQSHPANDRGEYLGKGWPSLEQAQRVVDNLVGEKPAQSGVA